MKTITIQVDVPDDFELNGERHNVEIYDDVDGFFYTNFSWCILDQAGEVVVTRNDAGAIVSVTRQDADGKILYVIAEAAPQPTSGEAVAWAATSEDGKVEALGFNQSRRFDTPLCFASPSQLIRDGKPTFYISLENPTTPITHRMHESDIPVWCKDGSDGLEAIRRVSGIPKTAPAEHVYYGAGQPDCPREIKGANGELHTLRCRNCGLDSPRSQFCRAAPSQSSAPVSDKAGCTVCYDSKRDPDCSDYPCPKCSGKAKAVPDVDALALELMDKVWKIAIGGGYPTQRRAQIQVCLIDFLQSYQPAPVCPDGYVMVREDATPAMISAALNVDWSSEDAEGAAHNIWNAMLAAAPQPVCADNGEAGRDDRADMFWDRDNNAESFDSIDELVNYAWGQGAEIGCKFTIQRAMSLPDIEVRLTWTGSDETDGETSYEVITTATSDDQQPSASE